MPQPPDAGDPLAGRVALVTGAGRRVGRAIALALGARGMHVVVHFYGSRDCAEETARLIGATAGPTVSAVLRAVGEHWDGSGQPDGVAGADIPVAARIIAVAIALVTGRETAGPVGALEEITALSGTRFDPTVVRAAEELVRQR